MTFHTNDGGDDDDDDCTVEVEMMIVMISSYYHSNDDDNDLISHRYKGCDDFSNLPCDMIVFPATYHDDRVLFWNPTCTVSMMFQFKCLSI